ncbi:hypothetical protein [Stieleria bergensis]|uniref:hypothetical protein n=1 Tax=Stieleria bergensis TaxID=2528025 RepID=UPI003AF3E89C
MKQRRHNLRHLPRLHQENKTLIKGGRSKVDLNADASSKQSANDKSLANAQYKHQRVDEAQLADRPTGR